MPKINTATKLDKGLERWIFATARKNLWRVPEYYDIDDLIGDGYLIYAECRRRYRSRVTERRHFMALFQRCYGNHITDLAHKRSKNVTVLLDESPDDNVTLFERLMPPVFPEAELSALLQEMRFPLNALVKLFYSDSGLALLHNLPQNPHENINTYLCRLLSLDHKKYNLPELFKSFLSGRGMYNMRESLIPLTIT